MLLDAGSSPYKLEPVGKGLHVLVWVILNNSMQ